MKLKDTMSEAVALTADGVLLVLLSTVRVLFLFFVTAAHVAEKLRVTCGTNCEGGPVQWWLGAWRAVRVGGIAVLVRAIGGSVWLRASAEARAARGMAIEVRCLSN